jgi:hypothetical protein
MHVRFEVFTAVTMKNGVFWDVMPCGSCRNRFLQEPQELLAYAADVNLLRDNIKTIKKNTETLIGAIKEVGLEINIEETKYVLVSCYQNPGQNWDIKK